MTSNIELVYYNTMTCSMLHAQPISVLDHAVPRKKNILKIESLLNLKLESEIWFEKGNVQ